MDLELDWNLFQIHAELRLAAVAVSLATFLRDLHPAPSLEKKVVNELQVKPRAPTSNGMQWTFHPLDVHSATRSVYLAFLNSCLSPTFISHGTVSSPMTTVLALLDQMTISGLRSVTIILNLQMKRGGVCFLRECTLDQSHKIMCIA